MKITVNKDNVKIEEFDVVHEGEHRVNKCSFSFSEEYTEELVKKAIFTSQNSSVEVAIINNECDIPTEILKARNIVLLGVYAYKVVDDKLDLRYSPSPDAFKVNSGSYIEGASESEEITPSQFEQYMQALNDGLNKVEESIKKMGEATSSAIQLVDDINQKLENGDFIGPEGTQGPQGVPGKNGTDGADGADGVGITTITSGQSTVEEDKTITPITVQKSDGSSQIFKVEAKNGLDGQNGQDGKDGVNGQDGLTPTIGDNGNWFIGDTDTGKPSRGEVGPTPDLSDYVKNTDYATSMKAGIVKGKIYGFNVDENGNPSANIYDSEAYKNILPYYFLSKGTLENIKNDYVGSSTPVQDLTSTVTNIQEEQDESKPKNTASGEMITIDDALAYKMFEFKADGSSEQETTTGKNKLDYTYLSLNEEQSTLNGGSYTYENGLLEIDATKATNNMTIRSSNISNSEFVLKAGTYYAHVCINTKKVSDGTFTQYMAGQITLAEDVYINQWFVPCPKGTKENTILMIEPGNEKTEWEPYTGGKASPSPDYPQPITTLNFDKITRCGKNLATENFANQNSIINLARTLKKGEKITIVINMTKTDNPPSGYGINIYDQDNEQLWGNSYTNWQPPYDGWNSFVVTVKNDTNRLRINAYGYQEVEILTAILSGALVEENKYIHDGSLYEPYQGQTYDIDLQGNEMVELPNGVKDELVVDKYGNVSLIKNVSKVVYDGINKKVFVKHSSFVSDTKGFYLCTINNKNKNFDSGYTKAIKCDSLIARSGNAQTAFNNYDSGIWWEGNTNNVYMILSLTTIDEVNNWLQEHNVTFYYQLENPEVIPLGKLTNLITTEEGINNFFINGNLETILEVLYALDIKKYIDNKLAEISTAMIEEG